MVKSPEHLLTPEALVVYNTPKKKLERFIDKIKTPSRKIFNEDLGSTDKSNNKNIDTLLSKVDEMIPNKKHRKMTPNKQTPKKNLHTTTNENNQINVTESTPSKTKKTPKKLFNKSPNVNEFNVQIIESFVKITPSKSQKNRPDVDVEFVRSSEKKQSSILKYISPTSSAR